MFSKILTSLACVALLTGCAQTGASSGTRRDVAAAKDARTPPGMNAAGEVTDPAKVEAGHGPTIKGLNDFSGEVTGVPAPGSRFTQLQIGMPLRQVMDLCGPPTDQGAYLTGKAFIPFYFGSDRERYELVYQGWGRLIFAGGSFGDLSGGNLIWVIHSAAETGYR